MKPRKSKAGEPSLLDQLSEPLRGFVNDFKTHGTSTFQRLREENLVKWAEQSVKLIGLIATLNPALDEFAQCQTHEDIGRRAGLNSGEVVIRPIANGGRTECYAMGQTIHLADRLAQIAAPGTSLTPSSVAHRATTEDRCSVPPG
jgi:class 3 adenylate cyclase